MEEFFTRLIQDMGDRLTGPLRLRFLFQPAMAAFLAIRAGIEDERDGEPPYFLAIFSEHERWKDFVREGWKAVAHLFTIAVLMDVVYQLIALRQVYVLETLLVAVALAVLPYLLLRGPVNRITQIWRRQLRRQAPDA